MNVNGITDISGVLGQNQAAGTQSTDSTYFSNYMNQASLSYGDYLEQIFQKASDTYNVSKDLLKAMAKAESNFRSDATSHSGAMGIMQLMPATAASLGVSDAYNPEQNIMGGAKLLGQYALSLFGSLGLVSFLAAACTFFFASFPFWRSNVVLTYLLYFCRDYILLLFLISVGLCWLGCTVHFIRKPLDFLDEMAEAAEEIHGLPPETPVYVSKRSSTIHLVSDCCNMKHYREMTLGEADAKGYDCCLHCF